MKVIILAKSIDGGTGTFFLSFMNMQNTKVQVVPCVLEDPQYRNTNQYKKKIHFFSQKISYPEIYYLNLNNLKLIQNELIWFRAIINNVNPDTVISIDLHSILLTELAKLLFGFKFRHVATIHNNIRSVLQNKSSSVLRWFLFIFSKLFVSNADIIVCVSALLAKDVKSLFSLNTIPLVINYGIFEHYKTKINEIKEGRKTKIILSIARLCEQKDHKTLLNAFARIQKENINSILWLVGDGPLKSQLIQQIAHLKLTKKVKLLGWFQNIEILLQQADIFILSTKREGFPYVLLEALQAGLPIIATDCYFGPREILANGKYGLLTKIGNEEDLAKKINCLLNNPCICREFQRKAKLRSKVFTEKKMLHKYLKLLNIKNDNYEETILGRMSLSKKEKSFFHGI